MSTLPIILIVDDDSSHRAMLRTVLRGWGYATDEADDGDTAVEKVKERAYDAVLSDVRMARMDGISAIREILHHNPSIPVLVMTAWQSVETAVAALRLGAYDYLEKPLDFDLLHLTLERALDHTRLAAENRELREYIRESPSGLLGRSPRMRELIEMVNTVAPTEATVLITGESGTGKERVARAIQEASARRGKAFVTVNCAALNESLLESELFGHEKGAFTGADKRREGRFSQADGGTLFLDEIGELPLLLQAKLLRALQQGEVQRVGSDTPIIVDVRVIAATNRNLREEVSEGRFREDLYYRLNVIGVEVPSCGSAARTSPCSPRLFWSVLRWRTARRSRDSLRRRWMHCSSTLGPATCANWRTPWSGRLSSASGSIFPNVSCLWRCPPRPRTTTRLPLPSCRGRQVRSRSA